MAYMGQSAGTVFAYERPAKGLAVPGGLTWSQDEAGKYWMSWNPLTDTSQEAHYCLEVAYADRDWPLYSISGLSRTKLQAHPYWWENHQGYFKFRIKAIVPVSDYEVCGNGAWSEWTKPYLLTKEVTTKEELGAIADSSLSADQILTELKKIDQSNLQASLAQLPESRTLLKDIEKKYTEEKGISVSVSKGNSNVDASKVSIVGAAFSANTTALSLNFAVPSKEVVVDKSQYKNWVQLNITLDGVENPGKLAVPAYITMPVPAGVAVQRLFILHYHADGSHDVIKPIDNGDGTVTFVITSFSTFVFANEAENISGADPISFTDSNFKAALLAIDGLDANKDNEISCDEAKTITKLNVAFKNISSLSGIEYFTGLVKLECNNNQLASLDVTALTELDTLFCGENQLQSINVSGLTKLRLFSCYNNRLANVNLSGLTALTGFQCNDNLITGLDLTGLTSLAKLYCKNNYIPSTSALTGYNSELTTILDFEPQNTGKPSVPRNLKVETGNGIATLSWEAPDSDGGSSITGYEFSVGGDEWSTVPSGTGCTITGLKNGTYYAFGVRAVNANGAGLWAATSAKLPVVEGLTARLSSPTGTDVLPSSAQTLEIAFNRMMDKNTTGTITINGSSATINRWFNTSTYSYFTADIGINAAYDTTYTLKVSGFRDINGNLMEPYETTFKTCKDPFAPNPSDTTAPTVYQSSPTGTEVMPSSAQTLQLNFSEIMDKNTAGTITVNGVASAISSWHNTASYHYIYVSNGVSKIAYSTEYTVKVSGFKDINGNLMVPYEMTFTTCKDPAIVDPDDIAPPTAHLSSPTGTEVLPTAAKNLEIKFSELMDITAPGTITINGVNSAISNWQSAATYHYIHVDNGIANPAYDTEFVVSIAGFKDVAGNVMTPFEARFKTCADPFKPGNPPVIEAVSPSGNSVAISTNQISVRFDQRMNGTEGTLTVEGANVGGGSWSADKLTYEATLSDLQYETDYTITISGFKSEQGVSMANAASRAFSTEKNPVQPAVPVISSMTPASGAVNVETNGTITITFDKAMRTTGVVSLNQGIGTLVTGEWSGNTYTCSYSGLAHGTTYTITITDFMSTDGGKLPPSSTYRFTTKAAPTYLVSVASGTGGGSYAEGATVSITANTAPSGQRFKEWTGTDGLTFTDGTGKTSATAKFTMSNKAVTVVATFENIPQGTTSVTGVALDKQSVSLYSNTNPNNATLTATVSPANASNKVISWQSNNGAVATVDQNGRVTAIGNGTAVITVTTADGGYTASCTITVTAYNTGVGDGGGGGTGGGGGGGTVITPDQPTIVKPDPTKPDSPTTVATDVKADSKGNANITNPALDAAIKKAQEEAKKNSTEKNGIAVEFNITGTAAGSNLNVNLSEAVLDKLAKDGIKTITLKQNGMALTLDLAAIKEIQKANGDVTLTVSNQDVSKLSKEAQAAIGKRPVYSITLKTKDGKAITDFGKGQLSFGIPYTLAAGEKAGNLFGVYVDDKGKVEWLLNSSYDAINKMLLIGTDHLSIYGVGYKTDTADTKFTDIANHWAKSDIEFVAARGLFSGTGDGKFSPNASMTRGMFVTALGRMAQADVSKYTSSKFTDVKSGSYYLGYVEWAAANGIVKGTSDTTFAPDKAISRQEMATIMASYAKAIGFTLPKAHAEVTFADSASIGTWAKDSVKAMQMAGVLMGKDGNKFDPQGTATRAEVSALLHRFIELAISTDTAEGWVMNDSGKWMYFENGKAVTGTKAIGGVTYEFDKYGVTADAPKDRKYSTYTVQKNDSLWSIAQKHGCSMQELASINGKTLFSILYVGDILKVPQK